MGRGRWRVHPADLDEFEEHPSVLLQSCPGCRRVLVVMTTEMPCHYFWSEITEIAGNLEAPESWSLDVVGQRFASTHVPGALFVPAVLPIGPEFESVEEYLQAVPDVLGLHWVVLMQAGAAAVGCFDEGHPIVTKCIKKYVTRGRGHAQPTHLRSKGKSRYGARLRLRNALQLNREVAARLQEWAELYGNPQHVFYSCPIRILGELRQSMEDVTTEQWIRVQRDMPVPTTDVVLKTYRGLCHGRVE